MLRSSAAAGKGGRILAAKQVNPTRMELTRLKKKRITAIRVRDDAGVVQW